MFAGKLHFLLWFPCFFRYCHGELQIRIWSHLPFWCQASCLLEISVYVWALFLADVLPSFSRAVGATCPLGSGVTFPLGMMLNVCGQVFPPFFSRAAGATCLLLSGVTFPFGMIFNVCGQVAFFIVVSLFLQVLSWRTAYQNLESPSLLVSS